MKITDRLIKQGYLEDTKKGYVMKKNFTLTAELINELDKPIMILDGVTLDLTKGTYVQEKAYYTGSGELFKSLKMSEELASQEKC